MFDFIKKYFKNKKKEHISLIVDESDNVLIVYKDKTIKKENASIEVEYVNNFSKISNLFNTNQIQSGLVFSSFALLSTDRFKDKVDDYELLGEYYISMTNGNLEFAYIFNTGSDTRIPATGIGVDSDTFSYLEKIINENKEIILTIDSDIKKAVQYLSPALYYVNQDEKSGTKICGCQNKKRK